MSVYGTQLLRRYSSNNRRAGKGCLPHRCRHHCGRRPVLRKVVERAKCTIDDHTPHPAAYPKAISCHCNRCGTVFGRDVLYRSRRGDTLDVHAGAAGLDVAPDADTATVAVVAVVIGVFAAIFMFGAVVAHPVRDACANLPLYQSDLEAKVKVIKDVNVGEGIFGPDLKLLQPAGPRDPSSMMRTNSVAEQARSPPAPEITVEVVTPSPWTSPGVADGPSAVDRAFRNGRYRYRGRHLHAVEAGRSARSLYPFVALAISIARRRCRTP